MGYRRSHTQSRWTAWVRKNHEHLCAECGIPDSVLSDWENWLHLLDHGFCRSTGFDLESLSARQLKRFFDLVELANEPEFAHMTYEFEKIRRKLKDDDAR